MRSPRSLPRIVLHLLLDRARPVDPGYGVATPAPIRPSGRSMRSTTRPTARSAGTSSRSRAGDDLVVETKIEGEVRLLMVPLFKRDGTYREVWRGDRLIAFDSRIVDNDEVYEVSARADGDHTMIDGRRGRIEAPADHRLQPPLEPRGDRAHAPVRHATRAAAGGRRSRPPARRPSRSPAARSRRKSIASPAISSASCGTTTPATGCSRASSTTAPRSRSPGSRRSAVRRCAAVRRRAARRGSTAAPEAWPSEPSLATGFSTAGPAGSCGPS